MRRKIYSMFTILIAAFVGLYIGACVQLYVRQASFIYKPSRAVLQTPQSIGLHFENVNLKSSNEANLGAWYIPAPNAPATVLFCHGNGGNVCDLDTIEFFHNLGLNLFVFDYQGYGTSDGNPSEINTYADAEAAWRFLTEEKQIPSREIVILGRSLGGAIGAWLAEKHTPAALILEGAFISIEEIASEMFPYFPTRFLTRYSYATGKYIERIKCPILIAHSPSDGVVPYRHGQELFERFAREPKMFLELKGDHCNGYEVSGPEYSQAVEELLRDVLKTHVSPTAELSASESRDNPI